MKSGPQVLTFRKQNDDPSHKDSKYVQIYTQRQETSKDGNPSGDRVFLPCKVPRWGKKASSFYPRCPLGVVLRPTWTEMSWVTVKLTRGESRTFWEGGQEVEGQTAGSRAGGMGGFTVVSRV